MKKLCFYSFAILHLIIILYFWWSNSGVTIGTSVANTFLSFGRLFGLVGASLILLQFILIGRTRFIEEVFGLDKLARLHRLNGKLALCIILIHPVLLLLGYSLSSGVSLLTQEITFLTQFENVLEATIGLGILCVTVFFSIAIVRRNLKYEWWYGIHLFNYLALLFVFGHQWQLGEDFLASKLFTRYWLLLYTLIFISFLIFRVLHQLYLYTIYRFRVVAVKKENDAVTSIYIGGKQVQQLVRKPGQFFLYRFLDKKLWWQEHPFSLSNGSESDQIRLSAKAVGDFTRDLRKIPVGTRVIIDGPFGVFTTDSIKRKKFLLIAGGIGITPLRSIFEELSKKNMDTTLLYLCSKKSEITFQKELDSLSSLHGKVVYILTQEPTFSGEKGRLDRKKLQKLVPDITTREVYICGPVRMMEHAINEVKNLGVSKEFIHYERFAL